MEGLALLYAALILAAGIPSGFALGSATARAGIARDTSLQSYLDRYRDAPRPDRLIAIEADRYVRSHGASLETLSELDGVKNAVAWRNEAGWVEWDFNVEEAGLYELSMLYHPLPSRGMDIELALAIDGAPPFSDVSRVDFSRVWADATGIRKDWRDNDLNPKQAEVSIWTEEDFRDTTAFFSNSYPFYLSKGAHRLRLTAIRESFAFKRLSFYRKADPSAYADVQAYKKMGVQEQRGISLKVQAELPYRKSEGTLTPWYDRNDPATEPFHPVKIRRNTIGAWDWWQPGMWISWKFDVPEDGLYKIVIRARQNFVRGSISSRRVAIDGVVPFKEFEAVEFPYDLLWKVVTLGNGNTPYLVHLTKGTHVISMEATLGRISGILTAVDEYVYQLNNLYRKILMITGAQPDVFRDYNLDKEIPGMVDAMREIAANLTEQAESFEALTGERGGESEVLRRMSEQLTSLADRPETIPERLTNFQGNISGLSFWTLIRQDQSLQFDWLMLASPDVKAPAAEAGLFRRAVARVESFIGSFFEDYNNIGGDTGGTEQIRVWVNGGRNQAQILMDLIMDRFSPDTKIDVVLSLIPGGLIEATLAGKAPDIALGVDRGQPVNLAARGAVLDLSRFPGFKDVVPRFAPTAIEPYTYKNGAYALPQQQNFFMLFYRKDIFRELGIQPPETWEDLYRITPILQKNNMSVGLPYQKIDTQKNNAVALIFSGLGAMNLYPALLMQNGGSVYDEGETRTGLDSPAAVKAFKEWTDFYNRYSYDVIYDFYSRFRIGEMPIGIASFTTYQWFALSAPEIRNEWEMVPIPGVRKPDGTVDRSEGAGGNAAIIFSQTKHPDACWKFLTWWTSDEIQTKYGKDLETLMGPAGRYDTANVNAFGSLPWTRSEIENIDAQRSWVREIKEIPGSYYTVRGVDNAFSMVVDDWMNPREALFFYNKRINDEIQRKRTELGMSRPGGTQ
jgi:ABC-type glycerol-3-phosphate transport system substrate-binding protein